MNVRRWTLCLFAHRWAKVRYPGEEDEGFYLRCLRCGHESHKDSEGSSATGHAIGF